MRLPRHESAVVPRAKLTGYLLNPTHPHGRSKARFFRALGFDSTNAGALESQILAAARSLSVEFSRTTVDGKIYRIQCVILGTRDRGALVETFWIVPFDLTAPRLITAYPSRRS